MGINIFNISHTGSDDRHIGGLVSAATMRHGGEIGTVGLNQNPLQWAQQGGFDDVEGSFKGQDPRKTQKGTNVKTAAGLVWTASEAVKNCLLGCTFG